MDVITEKVKIVRLTDNDIFILRRLDIEQKLNQMSVRIANNVQNAENVQNPVINEIYGIFYRHRWMRCSVKFTRLGNKKVVQLLDDSGLIDLTEQTPVRRITDEYLLSMVPGLFKFMFFGVARFNVEIAEFKQIFDAMVNEEFTAIYGMFIFINKLFCFAISVSSSRGNLNEIFFSSKKKLNYPFFLK